MSAHPPSGEARLTIGRWLNAYLVPANHYSPEDLRRRLDQGFGERLPEICSQLLACSLDAADPAVWRIRTLRLKLFVEADTRYNEQMATAGGKQLSLAISDIIARGEENDSILRFPNRAAYLAQFVFDAATGRAWGKWYYDEFDSLSALPVSAAIREVFSTEPAHAASAIVHLASAQRLEEVLSVLTPSDADRLYQSCFTPAREGSPGKLARWTDRLLELWGEAPLRPAGGTAQPFHDALRMLARILAHFPGVESDSSVQTALTGLLEVRRVLEKIRSPAVLEQVFRALAGNDLTTAMALARAEGTPKPKEGLEFLAKAMGNDPQWAARAAGVLLSDNSRSSTLLLLQSTSSFLSQSAPATELILSNFGGIFLLGPSFAELNLGEIATGAAGSCPEPDRAEHFFRHLVAVKCLGRSRARLSADDAALRLLSGLDREDFLTALEGFDVQNAGPGQALSIFTKSLWAKERYEGRCLMAETVSLPVFSTEVLLLRDLPGNQWLYVTMLTGGDSDLADALERGIAAVGQFRNGIRTLLVRGRLRVLAGSRLTPGTMDRVVSGDSAEPSFWNQLAEELGTTPQRLARATLPPDDDLAWFSLASLWPGTPMDAGLDLTASLVARSALRQFARGLLGFEASSPEHLYQNFLSGASTLRKTENKIEVQLPRSPLSLVLRLAGISEQTYTLPWLDRNEVCLLPPME